MLKLADLTREQLEEAVHRLKERLEGRAQMNHRTAMRHTDDDVMHDAQVRVLAYETALGDLQTCFAPEKV